MQIAVINSLHLLSKRLDNNPSDPKWQTVFGEVNALRENLISR